MSERYKIYRDPDDIVTPWLYLRDTEKEKDIAVFRSTNAGLNVEMANALLEYLNSEGHNDDGFPEDEGADYPEPMPAG